MASAAVCLVTLHPSPANHLLPLAPHPLTTGVTTHTKNHHKTTGQNDQTPWNWMESPLTQFYRAGCRPLDVFSRLVAETCSRQVGHREHVGNESKSVTLSVNSLLPVTSPTHCSLLNRKLLRPEFRWFHWRSVCLSIRRKVYRLVYF